MLSPYLMRALPQMYPREPGIQDPGQMMEDPRIMAESMMYNPLNPYNPMHMARLLQLQNQRTSQLQEGEKTSEQPKLQDILNARMEFAVNLTSNELKNTENPTVILGIGAVEKEKNKFLQSVLMNLEKEGKITKSFKFVDDDYVEDNDLNPNIEDKNYFLADPVKHVADIIEQLPTLDAEVIVIKDILDGGSKDEIQQLIKLAKERNISILASSITNKLDGNIPENLPSLIDSSSAVFQLDGVDIFEDNQIANVNYVGVPVTLTGEVVDTNETYYSGLPKYERELIIKKFSTLPGYKKLITKRPNNIDNGEPVEVIMLPMNKYDLNDTQNPKNIIAVSPSTSDRLYKLAQAEPPARVSIYSPKILNWAEIGL